MEQLFCFNIDQLGRNLLVRKIQVAHDSKAAILAVDEAHEDRNILVLLQKDESGRWSKAVLGHFPDPGFGDIGMRRKYLLACETDWIALALARKANEGGSYTRVLLWGQEGTEQKELHLSGSLGTRVTLAGLALQPPFIILSLLETRRQKKAVINVYKLEPDGREGQGVLLMRSVSLPDLDFSPFETRIISNCHFLGFILQTWREKIVHLLELKDLLSEDISDKQTWTRKICLPCDGPRGEWGHLNIDMNTTSIVYADVTYFDNYDREETDVNTNVQKKDFWMGSSKNREDPEYE